MATHGSKAVFKIGSSAQPQVVTDASAFATSVGLTMNRDTAETTTLGKNSKTYIPGLKDATVPFEGPADDDLDAQMWDLFNTGAIVLFEYFPSGEGAGKPKYSGQCFVTSYELSSEVSDVSGSSNEFQVTGDVEREVQA